VKHLSQLTKKKRKALEREMADRILTAMEAMLRDYKGGEICEGCVMRVAATETARMLAKLVGWCATSDADAEMFLDILKQQIAIEQHRKHFPDPSGTVH